jgi:hypothetical protein
MDPGVAILVVLIVLAVAALAISANRRDGAAGGRRRGSKPGAGYHELRSDYQSGVGGGHVTTWKVPRDPQEYARKFIPKDRKK